MEKKGLQNVQRHRKLTTNPRLSRTQSTPGKRKLDYKVEKVEEELSF